MPFPLTLQVAEKRIQSINNLSTIFSPIPSKKKHKKSIDTHTNTTSKRLPKNKTKDNKIYESPINKLKSSINQHEYNKEDKYNSLRGSISTIKPSKGDTDTSISINKPSRTVFNQYKESANIPNNINNDRDDIKRGSSGVNEYDQVGADALIQEDSKMGKMIKMDKKDRKDKVGPNGIIKKIAESLDAWQANKRNKRKGKGKSDKARFLDSRIDKEMSAERVNLDIYPKLHDHEVNYSSNQFLNKDNYFARSTQNKNLRDEMKPQIYIPNQNEQFQSQRNITHPDKGCKRSRSSDFIYVDPTQNSLVNSTPS